MDICDNCKREPEEFETDTGEKAYWFYVLDNDITALMSDLTERFVVILGKEKPKTGTCWCIKCVESILNDI